MEYMPEYQYLSGDPRLIETIVYELKSHGIFDKFRKDCLADVDTKPAYQNLRQRVETSVSTFLCSQKWKPELNKNQLREKLRRSMQESGFLETGVERIVDQVVNPKILTAFLPEVEEMVYKYLGLEKPNEEDEQLNDAETLEVCTDLMPTDLEAISPDSVASVRNVFNTDIGEFSPKLSENDDAYMKDAKNDEYESPPFEPINDKDQFISENSNESRLSGISGLTSRGSLTPKVNDTEVENNDQDSHLSRISSNSQSSVIVSSNIVVNTSEDHTIKSNVQSTDESTKNDDMEDNNKLNVELKMDVESSMSCDSDAKALVIITESSNDTVEDKNVDQTNGNNKGKVENYTDKQMKNEVSKTSSESKSDKYKSHSSKKRISSSHSSHSDKHHSSSSSHHHKSKHRHHDKSDDKKERSDHDRDKYKKYKKSYKDSKDEKSHKDKEKVRDREREKEKDREREKERSRSTKSDHSKDRKDKHDSHSKHNSSEKHREGKSRSPHRDSSKSKSSSSGHSKSSRKHSDSTSEHGTKDNKVEKDGSKDYKVEKDGSKDYKVEKDKVRKKSRSQDDHSSAKNSKSSFRRSTDRDSNDGHGGGLKKHNISSHSVPSSNNNKETTSDTLQNDSKTVENTNPKTKDISSNVEVQNSKSLQKGDRKPSPVTERRKPKIASNIYEARKLIKVRRKIERQNQKEKLRHLKTQEAAQENSDLELTQYECDDDSSSNTKDNTAEKAKDTLPKEDAISKKTLKRDDNISKKGLSLESKNSNSGSPQFFGFAQNHRVYYDLDADEMDVVHNLSSSSHEFEDPQQKSKAEIMEIILGHDICIANQNGNDDGSMRNGFFKVSYCSDYDDDEESMDIDNSPTSNCVNNNVHKKQKLDEDSDKINTLFSDDRKSKRKNELMNADESKIVKASKISDSNTETTSEDTSNNKTQSKSKISRNSHQSQSYTNEDLYKPRPSFGSSRRRKVSAL